MKNNKTLPVIAITTGIILLIICIIGKDFDIFDSYKALFGVMVGVGSGLLGGGLGHLINIMLVEKDPKIKKKYDIETKDERNISINNHAKAKAFDTMNYLLPIAMLIQILLNVDLWVTFVMIVAYLVIHGIFIYYLNKYSKEM